MRQATRVARWALAGLICSAAAAAAAAADLRIVTYNIAMGLAFRGGVNGLVREAFESPRLVGADVIGLQEACLEHRAPIDLFRDVIERAHGSVYEYAFPEDPDSTGECRKGEVILSAHPIVASGGLALPKVGFRRSAAWADLSVSGAPLRVYNVHLSNRAGRDLVPTAGRSAQLQVVLDHWLAFHAERPDVPSIVLGDLNSLGRLWDVGREEPVIRTLREHLLPSIEHYRPTMILPYKTDWIFFSGLRSIGGGVVPFVFSDHLPVVADLRFAFPEVVGD